MGPTGFTNVSIKDLMDPLKAPLTKQYYVNDAEGDPTDIYHATASLVASGQCLRHRIEYTTVSGFKSVTKSAWETAYWDSAWDIV